MEKINKLLGAMLLSLIAIFVGLLIMGHIYEDSKANNNPKTVMVDKRLAPYVKEYVHILKSNDIDIPWGKDLVLIDFSMTLPPFVLGIAWGMNIDNVTLVDINYVRWYAMDNQKRRLLVFHELTHDVFNLEHFEISLMDTPMPQYVTKARVDQGIEELVKYLKK